MKYLRPLKFSAPLLILIAFVLGASEIEAQVAPQPVFPSLQLFGNSGYGPSVYDDSDSWTYRRTEPYPYDYRYEWRPSNRPAPAYWYAPYASGYMAIPLD